MLELGRRRLGFVAFPAECGAGLVQHFRIGRTMRVMAGGAFAGVGRLMFEFDLNQEIIVAGKANLLFGPFDLHRKTRFVTLVAFLVFVRRMGGEFGPWGNGIGHDRCRSPIQWLAVLVVDHHRMSVGRARDRNAIEKKVKPLLFCRRAAPEQNDEDETGTKKTCQ